MPTRKSPRKGSLQYWPRKRASKLLPSVNWRAIDSDSVLKGFLCYKAGMFTVYVKDNTPDSLTHGKKIPVPATILECPPMKIFSVRFYKKNKLVGEILGKNLDKELKRKLKIPKEYSKDINSFDKEYDDIRVICYSLTKKTNLKKTPDIFEVGLEGSKEEKLSFVKEHIGKEISVSNFFKSGQVVDFRGVTKGKGFQGPIKRFGIKLKFHKSEKGRRTPGSIGPWHPARVTFRVPMAGQLGMFTRVVYNSNILGIGNANTETEGKSFLKGIKNYGDIKTEYVIVRGSVMGPAKRQVIMTHPLRISKKQKKKSFEVFEIR